jgi:hypothetical protein
MRNFLEFPKGEVHGDSSSTPSDRGDGTKYTRRRDAHTVEYYAARSTFLCTPNFSHYSVHKCSSRIGLRDGSGPGPQSEERMKKFCIRTSAAGK